MSTTEHSGYIDSDTGKMGMWLFLFTELFLFGGLFIVYAVMRSKYSGDFHHAEGDSDHGESFTENGCTLLVMVSTDDYK